jgi:hypothetical protein
LTRVLWLTIDEMSMLTTPLLAHLSHVTGPVRAGVGRCDASCPFGALCIILFGDFHQFPPVANFKKELYHPASPDNICAIGKNLSDQFDIVVKLEE